jgi:hypothetical protein
LTFVPGGAQVTYASLGSEQWKNQTASSSQPLLSIDRVVTEAHGEPGSSDKATRFQTFSSFHSLPAIQPYVNRPEFQRAVHGNIVDKTDFDFYRANPNALRIINKPVDVVSLGEALSRANAYRNTLSVKAAGFDAEIEATYLDPTTGMILDGTTPGGAPTVHLSAALWTGIYVGSQAYRFEVTGSTQAKANVAKSLDGMLKLQEITGDWSQFARAIRPATGVVSGGWHAGTGAFANLEWLEGGNNDMLKGLYIAYFMGHRVLCTNGQTQYASLCSRIRTNAKHLADDYSVSTGSDEVDSPWLVVAVTDNALTKYEYQGKLESAWAAQKYVLSNNIPTYDNGIADWSGLNLSYVSALYRVLFAEVYDAGGDARSRTKAIVSDTWSNFKNTRLPLWHELYSAYVANPQPFAMDDFRWRMREFPFPKPDHVVDHRIRPDYVMSPYPSLPWKNDWTTTDRSQTLNTFPLFEDALDIYRFRLGLTYQGDSRAHSPAAEYLIAYWFARKHNLISATE